jgi:putative ABC transport system permease protein
VVTASNFASQRARGVSTQSAEHALVSALLDLGFHASAAHAPWSELSDADNSCAALAVSLACGPDVLLLDGMPDGQTGARILEFVRALACRTAVVWGGCGEVTARALDASAVHVRSSLNEVIHGIRSEAMSTVGPREWPLRSKPSSPRSITAAALSVGAAASVPSVTMLMASAASTRAVGAVVIGTKASIHAAVEGTKTATTPEISTGQLVLCSFMILVIAAGSWRLHIGLEQTLVVAAIRAFVQLQLLGLILVPIFSKDAWYLVIGYIAVMVAIAAQEASKRPPYWFAGMYFYLLASLSAVMVVVTTFGLGIVLGVGLEALTAIPIGGMVLNSCLSSASVALSNCLTTIAERKDTVEVLLALGATRFEAARDLIKKSVQLGLTPMISLMRTTGLVSISGVMTGQRKSRIPTFFVIRMYVIS